MQYKLTDEGEVAYLFVHRMTNAANLNGKRMNSEVLAGVKCSKNYSTALCVPFFFFFSKRHRQNFTVRVLIIRQRVFDGNATYITTAVPIVGAAVIIFPCNY